jgi:hypothetical protein
MLRFILIVYTIFYGAFALAIVGSLAMNRLNRTPKLQLHR